MNRDFKGVWIPKEVWINEDLTWMEKMFYVEIDSLDNENGCYASNKYFSEFFNLSKPRVSQIINALIKKGFLKAKYIREGKQVKKRVLNIINRGIKNTKQGYLENYKESNTSNNNIENNNTENNNIHIIKNDDLGCYNSLKDLFEHYECVCNRTKINSDQFDIVFEWLKEFYFLLNRKKNIKHGKLKDLQLINIMENISEYLVLYKDTEEIIEIITDYFSEKQKYYSMQQFFSKESLEIYAERYK